MERERRFITHKVEVRAHEEEKEERIIGYAAGFNKRSQVMAWFDEEIMPGAFDNVLEDDVRCLKNHDPNYILGRTRSGTLDIAVDDFGLRYDNLPPDTSYANDLIVSMKRGDVDQSSFGFNVNEDGEEWVYDEEKGIYHRKIHLFTRLYDVSPVTYPAYLDTKSLVTRSFDDIVKRFGKPHVNKVMEELQKRNRELKLIGLV